MLIEEKIWDNENKILEPKMHGPILVISIVLQDDSFPVDLSQHRYNISLR